MNLCTYLYEWWRRQRWRRGCVFKVQVLKNVSVQIYHQTLLQLIATWQIFKVLVLWWTSSYTHTIEGRQTLLRCSKMTNIDKNMSKGSFCKYAWNIIIPRITLANSRMFWIALTPNVLWCCCFLAHICGIEDLHILRFSL